MDESAIKAIGALAIDADSKRVPGSLKERLAVVPDDMKIVEFEKFHPRRSRFRGTFSTDSLADFAAYAKRREGEAVPVFVQGKDAKAQAFFNLGTQAEPGHADDIAKLGLPNTAAFAAMLFANSTKFDQRGLIDWLDDWSGLVAPVPQDGEESMTLAKAITAIRTINIKATSETESNTRDFGATRTSLDEIEARSKGVLPGGFDFTTEPFAGLPKRTFRLRLAVLTGGDKPMLTLRVVALEAHYEEIAQQFKDVLEHALGDNAVLTVGHFVP